MLCASPAYLAKRGTPATVEELDEHDHVLFTPSAAQPDLDARQTRRRDVRVRPPGALRVSNNFGAVVDVALAGGGIALISEFMVADDIASGTLVRVLPEWRDAADRRPRGLSGAPEPAAAARRCSSITSRSR